MIGVPLTCRIPVSIFLAYLESPSGRLYLPDILEPPRSGLGLCPLSSSKHETPVWSDVAHPCTHPPLPNQFFLQRSAILLYLLPLPQRILPLTECTKFALAQRLFAHPQSIDNTSPCHLLPITPKSRVDAGLTLHPTRGQFTRPPTSSTAESSQQPYCRGLPS